MGIFGSIGKFLFGGSKQTSQQKATSTSNSDVDPYAPVIPYVNDYLSSTAQLYDGGAPQFSDYEMSGYDALAKAAGSGGAALDPAIAENNKTLSGAYLDPDTNPYLADIAKRMGGEAGAGVNATFGGRGRSGSGLAGYYSGKGIADAVGSVYGTAYENERGRMGSAVGMAPTLEQSRYAAPQALISAGQNISARPYDINQQYGGILGSIGRLGQQSSNTGSTTQTNYQQNPGLVGGIVNSFTNKLFPGTQPW